MYCGNIKPGGIFASPGLKNVSQAKVVRNSDYTPHKTYFKDLYQQLKIEEYFMEVHQASERVVNESQALFFDLFQSVAWLNFYLMNYVDFGIDNVVLTIESAVENAGQSEVAYLRKLYTRLHQPEQVFEKNKSSICLHLRGVGMWTLLEPEAGFHLFLQAHTPPLPVEVTLYELEPDADPEAFVTEHWQQKAEVFKEKTRKKVVRHILRLYSLPDAIRKQFLVSDLRSGIIYNKDLTEKDLQLLFYANFPEEFQMVP